MGVYRAFADLLSYPRDEMVSAVDRCLAALPTSRAETGSARSLLLAFRAAAERLGMLGLENDYTAAFDLDPRCSLYVGYHLFGDTARRSYFMQRLAAIYRESGVVRRAGELPDYLPLVLASCDAGLADDVRLELLADAVVPALERLEGALDRSESAYAPAVRALLLYTKEMVSTANVERTAV